ncbi:MAG: hypothetical protein AAF677_17300 [Pseudomonadota bacterium]
MSQPEDLSFTQKILHWAGDVLREITVKVAAAQVKVEQLASAAYEAVLNFDYVGTLTAVVEFVSRLF